MPDDVYLIRHGQSMFNAALNAALNAAGPGFAPDATDEQKYAPFAYLREDQSLRDAALSAEGHRQVEAQVDSARALDVDIVLVSPLTRALQTATGLFGPDRRIEVSALHTERMFSVCDVGRSPAALAADFPTLRFEDLAERWWHHDPLSEGLAIEDDDTFAARVATFTEALAARPERRVAVVGHGLFFEAICGRHLENCEILRHDR